MKKSERKIRRGVWGKKGARERRKTWRTGERKRRMEEGDFCCSGLSKALITQVNTRKWATCEPLLLPREQTKGRWRGPLRAEAPGPTAWERGTNAATLSLASALWSPIMEKATDHGRVRSRDGPVTKIEKDGGRQMHGWPHQMGSGRMVPVLEKWFGQVMKAPPVSVAGFTWLVKLYAALNV